MKAGMQIKINPGFYFSRTYLRACAEKRSALENIDLQETGRVIAATENYFEKDLALVQISGRNFIFYSEDITPTGRVVK